MSFVDNRAGFGGAFTSTATKSISLFERCTFRGNEALANGGAADSWGFVMIADCQFIGNRAAAAGAFAANRAKIDSLAKVGLPPFSYSGQSVQQKSGSVLLLNVSFVENRAVTKGEILALGASQCSCCSCCFWCSCWCSWALFACLLTRTAPSSKAAAHC